MYLLFGSGYVHKIALATAALWVASCFALNACLNAKPLFNEYDPRLLDKLVYDEKLADVAAKQSAGRPTYCDNRYYRAVANGGQGKFYVCNSYLKSCYRSAVLNH